MNKKLLRDIFIIAASVLMAVFLAKSGILKDILIFTREIRFLGSFITGIFFVSIFTAAPAVVMFAEMAQTTSIVSNAIFGGLGALMGDLIIFYFVKDSLYENFLFLVKLSKIKRASSIFKLRLFRWCIQFIGAIIIASPLPDEIGLAMMGLSKMRAALFIPLSFALNTGGIFIIGLLSIK